MNVLGKRLRQLRDSADLSQKEFANILKIQNSTLSQYESGNRTPSDEIKKAIADYFGVTIDYLLGRDDPTLTIPENLRNVPVAFHGGMDGLEQEDIDEVSRFTSQPQNRSFNLSTLISPLPPYKPHF